MSSPDASGLKFFTPLSRPRARMTRSSGMRAVRRALGTAGAGGCAGTSFWGCGCGCGGGEAGGAVAVTGAGAGAGGGDGTCGEGGRRYGATGGTRGSVGGAVAAFPAVGAGPLSRLTYAGANPLLYIPLPVPSLRGGGGMERGLMGVAAGPAPAEGVGAGLISGAAEDGFDDGGCGGGCGDADGDGRCGGPGGGGGGGAVGSGDSLDGCPCTCANCSEMYVWALARYGGTCDMDNALFDEGALLVEAEGCIENTISDEVSWG